MRGCPYTHCLYEIPPLVASPVLLIFTHLHFVCAALWMYSEKPPSDLLPFPPIPCISLCLSLYQTPNLVFLAVSPEEKESWINVLNTAIVRAKNRILDEVGLSLLYLTVSLSLF